MKTLLVVAMLVGMYPHAKTPEPIISLGAVKEFVHSYYSADEPKLRAFIRLYGRQPWGVQAVDAIVKYSKVNQADKITKTEGNYYPGEIHVHTYYVRNKVKLHSWTVFILDRRGKVSIINPPQDLLD